MVLRFLLDTDTCIYIRKKKPPAVLARFEKSQAGEIAMSVISYGELVHGALKSVQSERAMTDLSRLNELIPVLPLPASAGECYGAICATLAAEGNMIGANDLWIAAHALASGLTLVTNNEREFRRVKNLKIENWAK
jgi:tRNA(fMet)-specific endonuclease VapC